MLLWGKRRTKVGSRRRRPCLFDTWLLATAQIVQIVHHDHLEGLAGRHSQCREHDAGQMDSHFVAILVLVVFLVASSLNVVGLFARTFIALERFLGWCSLK